MIIDFHAHVFPEKIASQAVALLAERSGLTPFTDGTAAGAVRAMDSAGISKSVLAAIATNASQTENVNDFSIFVNAKYGDRFIAFGSIHPDYERYAEEMERLKNAGIRGIKLHPDYQEFYIDEERGLKIIRKAAELGLVLLFHAGRDVGLKCDVHCTPKRAALALELVPEAKIVLAHMGGWDMWDEVKEHLLGKNVYLDTSFSISYMGEERFLEFVRRHGSEKILFGTDSPWAEGKRELDIISGMPLTYEEKRRILYRNAERLLMALP